MAQATVLIKKYENRRLYDATNSRYVNLEDVAQILKSGDDVRVVDAATGADITRLILTQIIVEDAKTPDSEFPLEILRQMVVASGRASQESALKYINAMLDVYQNTYRAMAAPINPFDFFQRSGATRGATAADAPSPANAPVAPASEPPAQAPPEAEEMDGLKSRIADLEKIVSSLAPRKSARKKKTVAKRPVPR
jgi:polyhydroxyalkanoate synthesis repressor PhaR